VEVKEDPPHRPKGDAGGTHDVPVRSVEELRLAKESEDDTERRASTAAPGPDGTTDAPRGRSPRMKMYRPGVLR